MLYAILIFVSLIVGGCAGGILGQLFAGKGSFGLAIVLASAFFYLLVLRFVVEHMRIEMQNNTPFYVAAVVMIISAILAFIGGTRSE